MANLKVSKEKLTEVVRYSENARDSIINAKTALEGENGFKQTAWNNSSNWVDTYWDKHKSSSGVKKSDYEGEEKDENGKWRETFDEEGYNKAVEAGARKYVEEKKDEYQGKVNDITINTDTLSHMVNIANAFININTLITNFENNINPELKKELETLEGKVSEGGGFRWGTETVTLEDGNEVTLDILYFSPDGTDEGFKKVAEVVNCSYTTMGMTAGYAMNAKANSKMTDKEFDEYMTKVTKAIGAQNDSYLDKGFFAVVSVPNVEAMYEDAMGKKYDSAVVANEYKDVAGYYMNNDDDDLTDVNASAFGPMAAAAAVAVAMNNKDNEELPDELKTIESKENENDKDSIKNFGENEKQSFDKDINQIIDKSNSTMLENGSDGESELPPEEGFVEVLEEGGVEPTPPPGPEDSLKISDELAQKIDDQIKRNEEIVTPEEMTQPEITSTDVDDQVRDEFYSKLTESDKLAEERAKYVEDYVNMTDEDKVKALEGLGYTGVVAAGLVADRATGQTAYILGIENQKMAEMSNNLAIQQGFMNHDTRFDDPVGMDYFNSGQANVDLTPISQDVQVARTNLTDAKTQYDASVTNANKAISDANVSKEKYNNVLNNIRSKNGTDPKNWTEEQVKEYNEVAREYNSAVDKANNAVKEVDVKKDNYAKQKEQYNVAYEKYREEAEKALQQTIENNDVPQDTFTDIGEPPTAPGDPIDTSISGGNLNIGGGTSPEEDQNQSNNNNGDPIPNTEGVVYE